jgi:hypothetical protein
MHEPVTIQDVYEALKRVGEKMVTREDIDALIVCELSLKI